MSTLELYVTTSFSNSIRSWTRVHSYACLLVYNKRMYDFIVRITPKKSIGITLKIWFSREFFFFFKDSSLVALNVLAPLFEFWFIFSSKGHGRRRPSCQCISIKCYLTQCLIWKVFSIQSKRLCADLRGSRIQK